MQSSKRKGKEGKKRSGNRQAAFTQLRGNPRDIPRDITGQFSARDGVEIELEIAGDQDQQGNPRLIAHIINIERV